MLFEGAQAALLDLDFGTYPFVTSSTAVAGGAAVGAGVGPRAIGRVLGVAKAYQTRVGGGPFPTAMAPETNRRIQERGREFGASTGRPRRCGWFDSVVLRYARRVNGLDELAITKLDVLDGLDEVRIAVRYRLDGDPVEELPGDHGAIARCEPEYRTLPGWKRPTRGQTDPERLPAQGPALPRHPRGALPGAGHPRLDRARPGELLRAPRDPDPAPPGAGPGTAGRLLAACRQGAPHGNPSSKRWGTRSSGRMRGAFPTGWRPASLARSVPPSFAGREDPPRRRFAPRRRARDLLHSLLEFAVAASRAGR